MARFYGLVGFGETVEVRPGVWEDTITEREYFGDVERNSRLARLSPDSVNDDYFVQNSISIVDDGYASEHSFAMRYVEWAGERWTVKSVEQARPRLLLRLGEVYNGPTPATP